MDIRPRTTPLPPEDRLDSWKAIAQHFHRDTRTVQRWEAEGLPVYRHHHSKHGSIYAYRSEIDSWWISRRPSALKNRKPAMARSSVFSRLYPQRFRALFCAALAVAILLAGFMAGQLLSRRDQAQAWDFIPLTRPVVAVLPFTDLSASHDQSALALALTAETINELKRSPSLRTLALNSPLPGANGPQFLSSVTKALNADEVLEGSIRSDGAGIQLNVQLMELRSGAILWSARFQSETADATAFPNRIARTIVVSIVNASPRKSH